MIHQTPVRCVVLDPDTTALIVPIVDSEEHRAFPWQHPSAFQIEMLSCIDFEMPAPCELENSLRAVMIVGGTLDAG
jgi:hypothetical protein